MTLSRELRKRCAALHQTRKYSAVQALPLVIATAPQRHHLVFEGVQGCDLSPYLGDMSIKERIDRRAGLLRLFLIALQNTNFFQ